MAWLVGCLDVTAEDPAPVSHDQTPSSDLLRRMTVSSAADRIGSRNALYAARSCSGRLPHPTEGRFQRPPRFLAAPATGRSPDSRGGSRMFSGRCTTFPRPFAHAVVLGATLRPSGWLLLRGGKAAVHLHSPTVAGAVGELRRFRPRTPFVSPVSVAERAPVASFRPRGRSVHSRRPVLRVSCCVLLTASAPHAGCRACQFHAKPKAKKTRADSGCDTKNSRGRMRPRENVGNYAGSLGKE